MEAPHNAHNKLDADNDLKKQFNANLQAAAQQKGDPSQQAEKR